MSTETTSSGSEPQEQPDREARATYQVTEVAVLLDLCPTTTYKLVREGTIPAVRMGGQWRIPRARFHDWLDSQSGGSL